MIASMKVKAGIRLLRAEARVGEVYLSPLYPQSCAVSLPHSLNAITKININIYS